MAKADDFDALRHKRLRYVDSARENDFEEGLRSLLSELYPDNAHFIYELLQNAEDARATVVEFELADDSLTVSHNGVRPFSLADIESITGIGKSTKKDDETQIGKFGVGFKAVFAYTTRPEIRSGDFSFAIADLFVPEIISGTAPNGRTTFAFAFDRPEKPAEKACEEVERGLRALDEKTLLFLNSIDTVTYTLPDGSIGYVERAAAGGSTIVMRTAQGERFVDSRWMRLVGPASVEHVGPNALTVAVAFKLEVEEAPKSKSAKGKGRAGSADQDAGPEPSSRIVPVDHGDVSIYFPAAKEPSGLYFHIHAPFASTVARDSVRDAPGNLQLVEDIGALIAGNLPSLRDQGLLDDTFLATLPNGDDPLEHPYTLIRDAITEAFNDLDITPARGSGSAPARTLVASPGEFRNWLTETDLPILLRIAGREVEGAPRWIRDRDGRAGRFLAGLDTIEFGWSELDSVLKSMQKGTRFRRVDGNLAWTSTPTEIDLASWSAWLEGKTDAGVANLYQLIGRGVSEWHLTHSADLKTIPMVRLIRRGKREHVKGPETYLPANRGDTAQARVPAELAYFDDEDDAKANNLRAFYHAAGVPRWNEEARIEARLRAYETGSKAVPRGAEVAKHLDDVRAFVKFALSNPESASSMFGEVPFLLSTYPDGHPDGPLAWVPPDEIYLDEPFASTGLAARYRWIEHDEDEEWERYWDEPERFPVAGIYLNIEGITEFLESVGATSTIEIERSAISGNPQFRWAWWNGRRESKYTVQRDWDIEDFDQILESADPMLLRQLWTAVAHAPRDRAWARFQANASSNIHDFDSRIAQRLKEAAWVATVDGKLKTPRETTLEDLPQGWARPAEESLTVQVGFGAAAEDRREREEQLRAFLKEQGAEDETLDAIRELIAAGAAPDDLRALAGELKARRRFPDAASDDPERRTHVAALDAVGAPERHTESRVRSVVVGQALAREESRSYLRELYTSAEGEMFCQACQKVMPFKRSDGEWYFEAIPFVGGRKKVHRVNALALCPLCAAFYVHKRAPNDGALLESLDSLKMVAGQGSVELAVLFDGRRTTLQFTGKHALDLRTVLRVAGEERD